MRITTLIIISTLLCLAQASTSLAQGQKEEKIILSGLVIEGDSSFGVIGAYVMIPKVGVGTISNSYGYFRLAVKPGDSILVSFISLNDVHYVVPEDADADYSIIVDMSPSNTVLSSTTVYPFPTKALFKEAFLELNLEDQRLKNMEQHLNQKAMRRMVAMTAMDGAGNHSYFMDQQIQQQNNQFFAPTFSILNPFAWAQFFKSIKRGDFKNE